MSAHLIPCLKMRKWRQEDEDLSQVTELVQDAARKKRMSEHKSWDMLPPET